MSYGPETQAILREFQLLRQSRQQHLKELQLIRYGMMGNRTPSNIVLQGGVHHEQDTIDKASTFTDTAKLTDGFNLIQISTDGDLTDISYKIQELSGDIGVSIQASLSPHLVGHNLRVLVTNSEAETGKTVYIDKYELPWSMLSAIQHGTPRSVAVSAGARSFYAEKTEYTSSANNYFETDQPLGTTPTLSMVGFPAAEYIRIDTIKYQLTPTNAVTYQLYLLEDAQANDEQSESDVFFDSDSAQASGTRYIQVAGGSPSKLPITIKLATAGTIYYLVDWSAASGDTTGYIKVYGEVLA